MVENMLQMLMGMVDNYLVAQISLVAVSGVSIANNIITIYQAIFIALGVAVSSLIARSLGENNQLKPVKYMADAIMVTLGFSVVLGLISLFGQEAMLSFLGADAAVTAMGGSYLAVVGGMIVSLGLLTSLGAIIRAQGLARIPMRVSFFINLLNALLSALSIYVFNLGILGVAWSTVISRFVGVLLLASFLPLKAIWQEMGKGPIDKAVFSLSLPAAGERLMMRAGDVLIIAIIVQFGTKVLAGNAIGETLTQFNYMPGIAMSTATVILVAGQLGSRQLQDMRETIRETFFLATLMMFVMAIASYLVGPTLIPLFTRDFQAHRASMIVLLFSLIGVPATAGTLIYTAVWQGMGKAQFPFYATTVGMWFIRIIFGYIIGIVLGYGLAGVWLATVLDNSIRWFYLAYRFKKEYNSPLKSISDK